MEILRKLRIEGTLLTLIKDICEKPATNIILNRDSLNVFLLLAQDSYFYHLAEKRSGAFSQCNKAKKEVNGIKIGNHR